MSIIFHLFVLTMLSVVMNMLTGSPGDPSYHDAQVQEPKALGGPDSFFETYLRLEANCIVPSKPTPIRSLDFNLKVQGTLADNISGVLHATYNMQGSAGEHPDGPPR